MRAGLVPDFSHNFDLELGTIYTAPEDGFVSINAETTTDDVHFLFQILDENENELLQYFARSMYGRSGYAIGQILFIPVGKGTKFKLHECTGEHRSSHKKFIYAK